MFAFTFPQVVSVLQALGIMWGISTNILGLTVLAVGNSLGDLVANIAVVRGTRLV